MTNNKTDLDTTMILEDNTGGNNTGADIQQNSPINGNTNNQSYFQDAGSHRSHYSMSSTQYHGLFDKMDQMNTNMLAMQSNLVSLQAQQNLQVQQNLQAQQNLLQQAQPKTDKVVKPFILKIPVWPVYWRDGNLLNLTLQELIVAICAADAKYDPLKHLSYIEADFDWDSRNFVVRTDIRIDIKIFTRAL